MYPPRREAHATLIHKIATIDNGNSIAFDLYRTAATKLITINCNWFDITCHQLNNIRSPISFGDIMRFWNTAGYERCTLFYLYAWRQIMPFHLVSITNVCKLMESFFWQTNKNCETNLVDWVYEFVLTLNLLNTTQVPVIGIHWQYFLFASSCALAVFSHCLHGKMNISSSNSFSVSLLVFFFVFLWFSHVFCFLRLTALTEERTAFFVLSCVLYSHIVFFSHFRNASRFLSLCLFLFFSLLLFSVLLCLLSASLSLSLSPSLSFYLPTPLALVLFARLFCLSVLPFHFRLHYSLFALPSLLSNNRALPLRSSSAYYLLQ